MSSEWGWYPSLLQGEDLMTSDLDIRFQPIIDCSLSLPPLPCPVVSIVRIVHADNLRRHSKIVCYIDLIMSYTSTASIELSTVTAKRRRESTKSRKPVVTSSGTILACCALALAFLTSLHVFGWDLQWQTENAMLIFALTVVAAWSCPQSPIMFLMLTASVIWCAADLRRESVWWIYLLAYVGRFAITALLIVFTSRARRDLKQAHQLARVDVLTGLPNRQAIMEALEAELSRVQRFHRSFTVAMLDCDGFKAINDQQGHHAGDKLLQNLASALRIHTRTYDCVGRLGGDEFVLLLSEADTDEVPAIIERLRASLHEDLHDDYPSLTFSIGVAIIDPPLDRTTASIDWSECLQRADEAMYAAKRAGRNQTRFFN